MTATKTRYRTPIRYAQAEVSLDEFTDEELRAEMVHRSPSTGADEYGNLFLPDEFVSRLSTLRLCGQHTAAIQELCDHLEPMIGKLIP